MKRIILFQLLLMGTHVLCAQAPHKISYQAVIRNSNNIILASKSIGLRVAILKGGDVQEKVYEESQNPVTNINGLMSLQIGTGKVLFGDISTINWASGSYFIKTEIDPEGGANYIISGLTELTSVPFALFAATSGSGNYITGPKGDMGPVGLTGATGLQGDLGAQGGIGLTGALGPSGPQGNQGYTGSVGAMGAQGPQGLRGLVGAVGLSGSIGPAGSQGMTGVDGQNGPIGAQGPQGPQGLAGIDGIPGGPVGPQGAPGLDGSNGTAGAQGAQGNTGSAGVSGTQGIAGPQGPAGEFSGTFSGPVNFTGDFSASGSTNTIGIEGNKSGQGVRIGNGRFTFNKPNEPVVFRDDYTATPEDIFDSGILVCERKSQLTLPSASLLATELPAIKTIGDIVTVLLICVEEGITIVPGEGGSLVGSNQVGPFSQRLIYIRFTSFERESYIIY
jgi:hypothetical protein